jgi:predicted metal-dependent phosphoesterase TrpH
MENSKSKKRRKVKIQQKRRKQKRHANESGQDAKYWKDRWRAALGEKEKLRTTRSQIDWLVKNGMFNQDFRKEIDSIRRVLSDTRQHTGKGCHKIVCAKSPEAKRLFQQMSKEDREHLLSLIEKCNTDAILLDVEYDILFRHQIAIEAWGLHPDIRQFGFSE